MDLTSLLNNVKGKFTSDLKQVDWPRTALLIVAIVAVFFAVTARLMPEIKTITTTQFKRVPEIQKVKEVQRVYVKCPEAGIVTLDKHQVANKLDIPWLEGSPGTSATVTQTDIIDAGYVRDDPADLQVTATADLPESRAGQQVVSVFNTESGVTTLIAKEKPLPWFQIENHGHIGGWYGLNEELKQTVDADFTWKFLQIKAIHLGIRGDVGSDGTGKLQAGTIYEW